MDKLITLKITKDGQTVKEILHNDLKLSYAIVSQLKRYDDGILLNGKRVNTDKKTALDDELKIRIYDSKSDIKAQNIPINILYEDEDIIALNKGRLMPTHPSQNHYEDTLANALMYYFKDEVFTFRAITRLDRDTSGVVLVAKNPYASYILSEDMKNKKIHKEYMAVVCGVPNPKNGEINAPIKRQENTVMLRTVSPDGKEAITRYETVKEFNSLSLVRLFPITGRTHQIRVHLSYIGTPIYGDDLYGAKNIGESTYLHCSKIEFYHPVTNEKMKIEAPMPLDMETIISCED